MHTQYLTFILRLRRVDRQPDELSVSGSVQQVGLEEIRYFDLAEKLQETLKRMIARTSSSFPTTERSAGHSENGTVQDSSEQNFRRS
jgi:hypothetical protein